MIDELTTPAPGAAVLVETANGLLAGTFRSLARRRWGFVHVRLVAVVEVAETAAGFQLGQVIEVVPSMIALGA